MPEQEGKGPGEQADGRPSLRSLRTQVPPPGWRTEVPITEVGPTLERWRRQREHGVELDPDFQRGHVWTGEQRSRWMEHLFTGGVGGREITFNCPGWSGDGEGPIVLVDGKQRLETLRQWFDDRVEVFGRARSRWSDGDDERGLWMPDVTLAMHSLETRAELLGWYLQYNGGGTSHSRRELERVRSLLEEAGG